MGLTYANVMDRDGQIQRAFGVKSLPHTVVIDRQGRIRVEVVGMSRSGVQEIRSAVEHALEDRSVGPIEGDGEESGARAR